MSKLLMRILLMALLVAGITLAVVYRDVIDADALAQWVKDFGASGPLVFMLIYALGTVLFLPGSVITLAGGALFGPLWGTLYNLGGATLGATLAFLIARYLAGDWVEKKSGGRIRQLKEGVEAEGWHFVAFVRLVPLFPFNVLNYALGLTRIRLSHYVIASFLCMAPGAFAYTYLGYVGREAVGGGEGLIQKALLALALLAVVSFLPRLIGRLRQGPMLSVQQLRERLAGEDSMLLLDVRATTEFNGKLGHIPGAVNIPLEMLPDHTGKLLPFMERPVAIVCHTDRRSAKAALLLEEQGFADVHVVRGGMTAWNAMKQGIVPDTAITERTS